MLHDGFSGFFVFFRAKEPGKPAIHKIPLLKQAI